MTYPRFGRLTAALLAAIVVGGCATRSAVAEAQAPSSNLPYTDADVHFMSAMIGHHAQAIAMAAMAPSHDASPSLQALAARVVNGQQDEIAIMQQWLRDRGKPVPQPDPRGMKMVVNGVEHFHAMPGMLTPEQMKQLDQARGKEFDRLFLQFMIQHHQGAVAMVKELFATHGAGQDHTVFKLASDINVDQITEIERMQKMLVELLFGTRAP